MAIVFDAKGTASNGGGTTVTWSHTISASSNRILFAQILVGGSIGSVTSLVFAGNPLSKIIAGTNINAGLESELWYLVNPPAGLGTFNGTLSQDTGAGGEIDAISLSYIGAAQVAPILGSVLKIGTSTNTGIAVGRVLTGTNSWFTGGVAFDNNTGTISTGVFRGTAGNGGMLVAGDNTAGTLAFSNTNGAANWDVLAAEFAPFVAAGTVSIGYQTLLGVGR